MLFVYNDGGCKDYEIETNIKCFYFVEICFDLS